MNVYDVGGVLRCVIENPVSDLLFRTPTVSVYRVKIIQSDDGELTSPGLLEIAAAPRAPGVAIAAQQLPTITSDGDVALNQLYKAAEAYGLHKELPGDTRCADSGNPPANFARLFPMHCHTALRLDRSQGYRDAVLLSGNMPWLTDWEYMLPARALCQSYCTGDSWSLIHMMIDYLCMIEAFNIAEIQRVIDPDFVWVNTRNSQLIYLGSATQSTKTVANRGKKTETMIQAWTVAYQFFYDWRRVEQQGCYAVTRMAMDELNQPYPGESGIRHLIDCISRDIEDEKQRDSPRPFAYQAKRGDGSLWVTADPMITRTLYYGNNP